MAESLERKYPPPDNPEAEKQKESQKESEKYLRLAKESPHSLSEEIKKNPKTEPLLRKLLWDNGYERIRDLNPIKLSENTNIAKMQKEIYDFVDINPETDKNPTKEKFLKWLIDSIIVENAELALKIIETKWKILIDMMDQVFSLEWLSQIAEWLKTSVMGIFSWDAYKSGKSAWELGLVTIGSWAGGFLLKKVGKTAMKAWEWMAVRAGEKTVLSQTLALWGKWVEISWKIVQAPYNGIKAVWWVMKDGVKKVAEKTWISEAVKIASEPLWKLVSETSEKLSPQVKKIIDTTKQRAKETIALLATPILVGSKDGTEGMRKLRGQIGAMWKTDEIMKWIWEKILRWLDRFPPEIRKYIDISSEDLYANERFKDLLHYENELWELSSERILGYGKNAIIVTDKDNSMLVIKIAQERPKFHPDWPVDKLTDEVTNHSKVATLMTKWYKEFDPDHKIQIPDILETRIISWKEVLQMTKVEWQSYHTLVVIDRVSKWIGFDMADLEWIKQMNDFQVRIFLDKKYNANFQSILDDYGNDLINKVRDYRNISASDIGRFENFLSSQNPPISIKDPNGGNYMLWRDGKYHIIDFARTE